jgi:hypothetical protein
MTVLLTVRLHCDLRRFRWCGQDSCKNTVRLATWCSSHHSTWRWRRQLSHIGRIFSCVDMEPQRTLLGRVVRVVSVQVAQLVVCIARSCLYRLTQDRCLLAPSGVKFLQVPRRSTLMASPQSHGHGYAFRVMNSPVQLKLENSGYDISRKHHEMSSRDMKEGSTWQRTCRCDARGHFTCKIGMRSALIS